MVTDSSRRLLLKAAMFGVFTPMLPTGCSISQPRNNAALIGCAIDGRDSFSVVVADRSGMPIRKLPIPSRGHGIACHSRIGHAVAFARRPGDFFMVFDYQSGDMIHLIKPSQSRHFYGHGVYSNDGRWLFATEGESTSSRGIIGVYDVEKHYQKVDEFSGFGLGPHEVIMMADETLAVGVGGVHTLGRQPQNLSSMKPNLSYLSSANGELLDQVTLSDPQLSIRHLAHDGADTVLCGQQYRGDTSDTPSLLAMHRKGHAMQQLEAEPEQWARFNHYIASIAATDDWILATSPRGNCYGIWSKASGKLVELASLPDASGVVTGSDQFFVSSGIGEVVSTPNPGDRHRTKSNIQWDNHWTSIA